MTVPFVRGPWQKQRSICFCLELFVTFSFQEKKQIETATRQKTGNAFQHNKYNKISPKQKPKPL